MTFVHERLAMLLQADFDGCMAGYRIQHLKGGFRRAYLAKQGTMRHPVSVCARRGLARGQTRNEEEVWSSCEPSIDYAEQYEPKWMELDEKMAEQEAYYHDDYVRRFSKGRC